MQPPAVSNEALYPRVLGAAWLDLHQSVRRVHLGQFGSPYEGVFRIRHGKNRLARALVRALRMPPAGDIVSTRLIVSSEGARERWQRCFDSSELVTIQQAGPSGSLLERIGPLQFQFRLAAESGALNYQLIEVALMLGPFRCNLPAHLSPIVSARETPTDRPDQIQVIVDITLPGSIRLLRYEGTIAPAGAMS